MAVRRIRGRVGRARLTNKYVSPAESGYTLNIRNQMQSIEETITDVINAIQGATPDALIYGLQPVFDLSQEFVPVKTGDLKASGYLEAKETANGAVAEIGYAKGGNPHYGVFVHEDMEAHHEPPTQAKFLQAALEQADPDYIQFRIAQFLRDAAGLQ